MRPSGEEGVKIVVVWGRVEGKGVAIGRVYARVTEGEQVKQGDEVMKRLNEMHETNKEQRDHTPPHGPRIRRAS